MKKQNETKSLKFCGYDCEYANKGKGAKASGDVPICMADNPIYCSLYEITVRKSSLCLENRTNPEIEKRQPMPENDEESKLLIKYGEGRE